MSVHLSIPLSTQKTADAIADLLSSRAEMLLEYFAIDIDADGAQLRSSLGGLA